MQLRNTIVMAVLVVIVGAFVYFYEIRGGAAREEAEERARRLMELEASRVVAVRVETEEGAVKARRTDDGWRIVEPVEVPADGVEIDTLLQALQEAEHERVVVEEAEELAPYGLDDPRITITAELEDGASQTLLVGKSTPVGFNVYMKRQEEPAVHLVAGSSVGTLEKNLHALRDKRILTIADGDVSGLEVETSGYSATVERDGAEERPGWRLTDPLRAPADADTVDGLLRHLRTDEAAAFVTDTAGDEELRRYGLDEPRIRLTVRTAEGAAHALHLGDSSEDPAGAYGRRDGSDTVFVVPSGLHDAVPDSLTALRNRTVVDVPRSRIEALELIEGEERVRIERSGAGWRIVEPRRLGADASTVSMLITDLVGLRADGFADADADTGLDSPQRRIRVEIAPGGGGGEEDGDGEEAAPDVGGRTVTVEIGDPTRVVPVESGAGGDGGEDTGEPEPVEARYVSTSEDETVYVVAAGSLEALRPALDELRQKTLVEFRQGDVTRLVVSGPAGEVVLQRSDGEWRLEAPEAAALDDSQAVTDVLWDLNYLRMEGVVREWSADPPDLSAFGLEPPAYRVRAFVEDEPVADVRLGRRLGPDDVAEAGGQETADQVYVRIGEEPAVYRVGGGLLTALEAALESLPSGS